jgi:hypothetical protein
MNEKRKNIWFDPADGLTPPTPTPTPIFWGEWRRRHFSF